MTWLCLPFTCGEAHIGSRPASGCFWTIQSFVLGIYIPITFISSAISRCSCIPIYLRTIFTISTISTWYALSTLSFDSCILSTYKPMTIKPYMRCYPIAAWGTWGTLCTIATRSTWITISTISPWRTLFALGFHPCIGSAHKPMTIRANMWRHSITTWTACVTLCTISARRTWITVSTISPWHSLFTLGFNSCIGSAYKPMTVRAYMWKHTITTWITLSILSCWLFLSSLCSHT